jgi:hypothetical protein
MLSISTAFLVLASMALASPVPAQERGITTMHEGRARLSFAERADILGLSLDDLISQDRQNVLAKYRQNVNLVKVSSSHDHG